MNNNLAEGRRWLAQARYDVQAAALNAREDFPEIACFLAQQASEKALVETHLARIEQHRPLLGIDDAPARAQAEQVRHWFREVFLHVIDMA